nr:saccharopine dehydrogenase NADP-binding domain-containing protein [Rhodoferax sp. U2-2l]
MAGVCVLLDCAGPFANTSEPLMRACIEAGAHYLDITAEINVYRLGERLSLESARSCVMLLPGVGWDMVPTDSLAQQFSRVAHPVLPRIALQVATAMSRGSAIRAGEIVGAWLMARVDGALVYTPHAMSALFNFGDGNVTCAPLTTMP